MGFKALAVLAVLAISVQAAYGQTYDTPLARLQASPRYSTLLTAAARYPEIVAGLSNANTAVTIFAPTNEAFSALLKSFNLTSADSLLGTAALNRIIQYHIVPYALNSTDLYNGRTFPTLLGTSGLWSCGVDTEYDTAGRALVQIVCPLSEAFVVEPNLYGGKSVIHGISSVQIPPSEGSGNTATAGK